MNHIYRSIWSEALATWIAVSEHSKGKAKSASSRHTVLATGLLLCSSSAWALPTGEQVIAGQVTVSTPNATQMQIQQNSQQAIVNWQGFSINPNEAVNIVQPNAQAALLNRVIGQDASVIQGQLHANGQVFLINPNGVLFNQTAQVDVGGLVASTLSLSDADFFNGKYHFSQENATGVVSNQGNLTAFAGGVVALIGAQVSNEGTITTSEGTTALAAGKTVDLDFKGGGLVEIKVPEAALKAQVENNGAILADGGRVVLTAKAAENLTDTVLNLRGLVLVRSLSKRNGEIILEGGDHGVTQISGVLDVSGTHAGGKITVTGKDINITAQAKLNAQAVDSGNAGTIKIAGNMSTGTLNLAGNLNAQALKTGDGGMIETSAARVKVAETAEVKTLALNGKNGLWLIDPFDFTIAANNGDITGASLSARLANGNVTISTTAGVSTLFNVFSTTSGNGDIFVNDLVGWVANKLTLNAQRNININANLDGSGTAQLALQYGQADTGGEYRLNGGSINLPAGANFSTQQGSTGAVNIYTVITSLGSQNSTSPIDLQGINSSPAALNSNYALGFDIDASDTKNWNAGAGFTPIGNSTTAFSGNFAGLGHTISNLFINSANQQVGLFGRITASSTVKNLGLVGSGSITGSGLYTGALVGINEGGTLSNVYSNLKVTGANTVGGLVGVNYTNGSINQAYTSGNVKSTATSGGAAGGLVGSNLGIVNLTYATGNVDGISNVGGLVGSAAAGSLIRQSYATGKVTGISSAGGLVGTSNGSASIINSFWDKDTTSQNTSAGGGTGLSTSDLMEQSKYPQLSATNLNGWDFDNVWWMADGNTRPFLRMELSTVIHNNHQLQLMAMNPNRGYRLVSDLDLTADLANASSMWLPTTAATIAATTPSGFVPIGDASNPFSGKLDGQNHTISGLTVNRPLAETMGLFGYTDSTAVIRNLGLLNVNISGKNEVGGLAGVNYASVDSVYSTGVINGTDYYAGGLVGRNLGTINNAHSDAAVKSLYIYIGGLVGFNANTGSILNSYATGNVDGAYNSGGLVGQNEGNIDSSYATNNVSGNFAVAGLVGYNSGAINNSYANGQINAGNDVGGLVGYNSGTLNNSHYDIDNTVINGSTLLTVGGIYHLQYQDWLTHNKTLDIGNYATSLPFDRASGYYSVTTLQSIKDMFGFADNSAYKFRLQNNIDLSSTPEFFIPYLNTEFDGAGHSFANLLIDKPFNANLAMFGQAQTNSTIKNLDIINAKVTGTDNVGGLVGFNQGAIDKVSASGSITSHLNGGGLIGSSTGNITNAYAISTVTGGDSGDNGGLVGFNSGNISNAYASGEVKNGYRIGGLVGFNDADSLINNAYAIGKVSASTYKIGGLIGLNYGSVNNAYATGTVDGVGATYAGGLIGYNGGAVSNSFWDVQTTTQSTADGNNGGTTASGLNTADLFKQQTYSNVDWDFANTWWMSSGNTRPFLQMEYSTTISNTHQLQLIAMHMGSNYSLVNNLDLTAELANPSSLWLPTSTASIAAGTASGFVPIGDDSIIDVLSNSINTFKGSFDGLNHTITGLTIYRPNTDNVGLFGYTGGDVLISNIGLIGGDVVGHKYVGQLVGNTNWNDRISHAYATGNVTGKDIVITTDAGVINNTSSSVGGLVGYCGYGCFIDNAYATGNVTGTGSVGGLAGNSYNSVSNSYATGNVTGNGYVGGLVGYNAGNISNNSYATGNVTGFDQVGGLAGSHGGSGSISNAHASGNVTASAAAATSIGGLVGTNSASITNAYATGNVAGNNSFYLGGLVGDNTSSISNAYATGAVTGSSTDVGGLVGWNKGSVNDVYATGVVSGAANIGGLIGASDNSSINHVYATGNVNGTSNNVGGLIGNVFSNTINSAYASGTVEGADSVGGLLGSCSWSGINSVYATGSVNGISAVGGLIGGTAFNTVSNAYATGSVSGSNVVGGLVGNSAYASTINNAYATGNVSGGSGAGGLIGVNDRNTINNSFWNIETTGQTTADGSGNSVNVIGKTTAEMMKFATFASWNAATDNTIARVGDSGAVWRIYEGHTMPLLTSFLTRLVLPVEDATTVYNGSTQTAPTITPPDVSNFFGSTATGRNAGFYNGYYSNQQGYDIVGGNLIITPVALHAISLSGTRSYDGTADVAASIFTLSGLLNNDDLILSGSGSIASKNVGTYNSLDLGSLNLGNGRIGQASNYDLSLGTHQIIITPAALTVTANNVIKTYDGSTAANGSTAIISGNLFGSDTLTGGSFTFLDKNAGSDKTVTVSNVLLNDDNNGGNYAVNYRNNTHSRINKANLTLTVNDVTKTYDGTTDADATIIATDETSLFGSDTLTSSRVVFADKHAGTDKTVILNNVSINDGNNGDNYAVDYRNNTHSTIYKANLTLTVNDVTKTYDGTTYANATAVIKDEGTLFGTDTLIGGSFAFTNKNAGSNKTVTVSNVSINDGNNGGNYLVNYRNNTHSTINKANLLVAADNVNKLYDGSTYTGSYGVSYFGFVNDESREVLSGNLTYTGSSQGAFNKGLYTITPQGLTASNYDISFQSGILNIYDTVIDPGNGGNSGNDDIVVKNEPEKVVNNNVSGLVVAAVKPEDSKNMLQVEMAPQIGVPPLNPPDFSHPIIHDVGDDFGTAPGERLENNSGEKSTNTTAIAEQSAQSNVSDSSNKQLQRFELVMDNSKTIIPTLSVKNSAGQVKRLAMSANNQYLSLLLEDGSVRVWDFQKGVQRQIITQTQGQKTPTDISAVNDVGESLSIANTSNLGAYDVISATNDSPVNIADVRHLVTSNDGQLALISAGAEHLVLWDSKENKRLWQIEHTRGDVTSLALSANKRYGAVLSHQTGSYLLPADLQLKNLTDAVDIVELKSGKIIKSLPNRGEQVVYMQFKDEENLQLGLANGEVQNWSITMGSQKTVANFAENVVSMNVVADTYSYVLNDGTVRVSDAQGVVKMSIQNAQNPFKQVKLLENGTKLLTVMANGDLSLWDVGSGKKMLRLFSSKQGWTVMDAFGRFDGSEDALENFSWLANDENIPLDSFSENYYEPGLLSSVLQNQDYLNSTANSVRAGISLPPKVVLQLAEQQATGENVMVQVDVYDRGSGIDKINIYHNGKQLNNQNVVISEQSQQQDGTEHRALTLNIVPSAGKNTLKMTASNQLGIENSSSELSFDGKSKAYTSSIKLLTVGIDHYNDANLNLDYSVADATAIGDAIKGNAKIASSKSLYNGNATKAKILSELKELSQGSEQDVLVIYFAGHGMAVGKEWYFLPAETKIQSTPEKMAAGGITATELSEIFKNSKIQHIFLMVDACYSGAGMSAFSKLENGQRYFTRQLSRSLGITVLTATTKDQQAAELKSLGHGLFTYLMAQEFTNKEGTKPATAHGIAESMVKNLPAFSKKMIGASQEPVAYTHGSDFILTDVLKESQNAVPVNDLKNLNH